MNLLIVSGNLGRDAELKPVDDNHVLSFPLGVQTGTRANPETMWVACSIWGKRAISLQQYLQKGMKVGITGTVKMDQYTDKNGALKAILKCNIDQIDLPPKGDMVAPAQAPQPQQSNMNDEWEDDVPY